MFKALYASMFCILGHTITLHAGVTDVHCHISNNGSFGSKKKDILKEMQSNGISRSFVISSAYTYGTRFGQKVESVQSENDFVAKVQKETSDKFFGLCSIPFRHPEATKEIERCRSIGLRGLKLHTMDLLIGDGFQPPDFNKVEDFQLLVKYLSLAEKLGMLVLIHSTFINQKSLLHIYLEAEDKFPNLKLILAHGIEMEPHALSALTNLRKYFRKRGFKDPKFYIELSNLQNSMPEGDPRHLDWLKQVRYFGIDNILFGSDNKVKDAMTHYRKIFTPAELRQILEKNPETLIQSL